MLGHFHRKILEALDDVGGFTVKQVRESSAIRWGINNHQDSGAIRSWLVELQADGLVEPIDDQKPVAWRRTAAGTAALKN